MNIAHLLPYTARFPLAKHNGRYEWALRLAQHQIAAGHSVTMYAAPGSHNSTPDLQWADHGAAFDSALANNIANIKSALQNPQHDIYHSHFDFLHYFVADTTNKPLVCTQHWFPTPEVAHAASFNTRRNVIMVPVTNFMAEENRKLGILSAETIYHGIDLNLFRYTAQPKTDRFIFVGRITEHKGVKEAVEIALAAGIELDIVGKVNNADTAYWQSILPRVDGTQIRYFGVRPQAEVATLLANARALIFPSRAKEAFGQTIIEAQACGTPVIIQDVGAAEELVQPARTGFIVNSQAEYIQAIRDINIISRADCRTFAEKFNITVMVTKYETLYKQQLRV